MSRSAARTHCTARSNCAQLAHDAWRTGDEAFTIGRWHRQVERAIERSGLAWTFLRPNFFVQNYVTYFADDVGAHQAIHEPAGDVGVSYVDARDIAQAAARVLTEPGHDGRAYDLAGPEALTHAETAGTLTCTLGTGIRHVH